MRVDANANKNKAASVVTGRQQRKMLFLAWIGMVYLFFQTLVAVIAVRVGFAKETTHDASRGLLQRIVIATARGSADVLTHMATASRGVALTLPMLLPAKSTLPLPVLRKPAVVVGTTAPTRRRIAPPISTTTATPPAAAAAPAASSCSLSGLCSSPCPPHSPTSASSSSETAVAPA